MSMKIKNKTIGLKHFSLIALFAFGLFFLISSCQKTERTEKTTGDQPTTGKLVTASGGADSRYMDPARENYIKQKFADPRSKVSGITYSAAAKGSPCGPTPSNCCITFDESYCHLYEEAWTSCFTQTDVNAIFRWTVYETMCDDPNAPPVNYTFTSDPGFGTTYTGTPVLLEQHFEIINYFCCLPPKCYMVKTFEVTFTMPKFEYASASSVVNTVSGSSSCLSPAQVITATVPLSIDVYCGYTARGFVDAANTPAATVLVSTQCALCLPMIHSQCPSSSAGRGLFEYRLNGSSGAYTPVTITSNSQLISIPGSSGFTYEYRLVFYYGTCSTTPLTGTFTPN